MPEKALLTNWSKSCGGRPEHRSNVAPLMASRFGPHGLMSVKCLYACNAQSTCENVTSKVCKYCS